MPHYIGCYHKADIWYVPLASGHGNAVEKNTGGLLLSDTGMLLNYIKVMGFFFDLTEGVVCFYVIKRMVSCNLI